MKFERIEIIQNAAHCLICDDYVFSLSRWDYNRCTCGNLAVDGGADYLKKAFGDASKVEDLSITNNSTPEEVRARLLWGSRGVDGNSPLTYSPIGNLTTEHLEAILRTQRLNDRYRVAIVTELRIRKVS